VSRSSKQAHPSHAPHPGIRGNDPLYRIAFEISRVPTLIVDDDMTIVLANAEFASRAGYTPSEIEGRMQWTRFVPETERPRLEKYHRIRRIDPAAAPDCYESMFITRNGSLHIVALSVSMIAGTRKSVIAIHDITERKQMEEELQKTQKLESLAHMAGGMAHDFNNALTIILSSISLARHYAAASPDAVAKLREAEKEIMRAKGLTSQLLTFSRGGEPSLKSMKIDDLVLDTAHLSLLGSDIQVECHVQDETRHCRVDASQIAQVISSIVLNARQAMPAGGTISIFIENVQLDQRQHPALLSGPYVLVTIRDTGVGISPEHLPRVFDPFFSTKPRSSGLGLSSSYAIITRHGGHIEILSEEGIGTTVYLYLPAAPESAVSTAPTLPEKTGSILLVEEDDHVRETVAALLREFGHTVTPVPSGLQAVQTYETALAAGTPYDTVILDLSPIGREGGRGCLKALLEIDAQVSVIGGSRYAESLNLAEYRQYGFAHVAKKPYNIDQLIQILRQVMTQRP